MRALLLVLLAACASGSLSSDDARVAHIVAHSRALAVVSAAARHDGALAARLATANPHHAYPARADEPVDIALLRASHRVASTLVGARAALGAILGGAVVYAGALPDTDRVLLTDAAAAETEELLVLHGVDSPRAFTWKLQMPDELTRVRASEGGLTWEDARGQPRLRVDAPYAIDARGARLAATLAWDDATRVMRVALRDDTGPLAYPVVLDPVYRGFLWTQVPLLTPQTDAQIVYDAARGRITLYNGVDLWTWNGTTWARATPAQRPPPRSTFAMTYDAARSRVVVFGGQTDGGEFDDTWLWDGTTWTEAAPVVHPSARAGMSMAFDGVRGVSVLFGGYTGHGTGDHYSETWTWDGASWSQLHPVGAVPQGPGQAMTFDAAHGRVVLVGTSQTSGQPLETWTWDGTRWAAATATQPSDRYEFSLAFDPLRAGVVLFGGQDPGNVGVGETWLWDGTTWSRPTLTGTRPEERSAAGMAFDAARGETVLFGGWGRADTWRWDGTAWSLAAVAPAPTHYADLNATMFDAYNLRIMLYRSDDLADVSETWHWTGAIWLQDTPTMSPPGRRLAAFAYDDRRQRAVVFGGVGRSGLVADTWIWDRATWFKPTLATKPGARFGAAMAYDAAREEIVLFGGRDANDQLLDDTWRWNGMTWTQASPVRAPARRVEAAMAYDAARAQVVLFGGTGVASFDDTWLWDGANWTRSMPPRSPAGGTGWSMAWMPTQKQIVMHREETWLWDGASWRHAAPSQSPAPGAMAFDVVGNTLLSFARGETYRGNFAGGDCATNADCPGGFCVDAVCCEASDCGTCETCNGTTPGRCSFVLNDEDDTCAYRDNRSCSAQAECKAAPGVAAASAAECASGFLVDGVCCDTACTTPCFACRADLKATGQRSGFCDVAKSGVDPHEDCTTDDAATCRQDGTCDGRGACRLHQTGVACGKFACDVDRATGLLCNGLGSCTSTPTGTRCGGYACNASNGCGTTCTIVLFGGSGSGDVLGDTWIWNGTSWRNVVTAKQPEARSDHAMAYDVIHGKVVLLAGRDRSGRWARSP